MIELKTLEKRYSSSVRIGPVDLEIPAGGITTLVGPNGAGKSTLLTMIGRLIPADHGSVSIGGHNVFETKPKELAKVVSVLRQDNHFVTRLTVRQLVGFGRFPYTQGRLSGADQQIISKYIDFFDLGDLEDRFLDQLSGGQRQRAYVAMVLTQETDYVLLDEPLNNLDIAHSAHMMRHLARAAHEFGRTIVTVLHDINFAAKYSTNICAVKDGGIAAFGSPAQIMDDQLLTDLFETPVRVLDGPDGPLACYY